MSVRIGGFATLLQVFDMPTSLAFYRDVLGFEVVSEVPEDGASAFNIRRRDRDQVCIVASAPGSNDPVLPRKCLIGYLCSSFRRS